MVPQPLVECASWILWWKEQETYLDVFPRSRSASSTVHHHRHTSLCLHQNYRNDFTGGWSCPSQSGSSRLVTCFLFFGPLGLPFVWNLCVLVSHGDAGADLFQCPRFKCTSSDASYRWIWLTWFHPQHDLLGTNPPYEPHFTTCQLAISWKVHYCSSLEGISFQRKTADFLWMLLCGAGAGPGSVGVSVTKTVTWSPLGDPFYRVGMDPQLYPLVI